MGDVRHEVLGFTEEVEAEYRIQQSEDDYHPYASGPEAWAFIKAAVDLYWEAARRSVESPWIDQSKLHGYLRRSLVLVAVAARRAAQETLVWPKPWADRVREVLVAVRAGWGRPGSCLEGRSTIVSAHEGYGLLSRCLAHVSLSVLDDGGDNAGFMLCMLAVIAQAIAEDLGLCALQPTEEPTR